jgi:hypothetical protein
MKKLLYLLILAGGLVAPKPCEGGTNASLIFRTNDFLVLPTNIWYSNAAIISAAIGTGTNTNVTRFAPATFATNGNSQIVISGIDISLASNLIPVTSLPSAVATLSSNNGANLTNLPPSSLNAALVPSNFNSSLSTLYSNNATNLTNFSPNALSNNLPVSVITNNTTNNLILNGQTLTVNSVLYVTSNANFAAGAAFTGPGTFSGGITGTITATAVTSTNVLTAKSNLSLASASAAIQWNGDGGQYIIDDTNGGWWFFGQSATEHLDKSGNFTTPGQIVTAGITASTASTNTGAWIEPATTLTGLTAGNNSSLAIGTTGSYFILSGPSGNFAISGIANGWDGRTIKIENSTGWTLTWLNNSGIEPNNASTNRLYTGTGGDVSSTYSPWVVTFRYDGTQQRWKMLTGQSGGTVTVSTGGNTELGLAVVNNPNSMGRENKLAALPLNVANFGVIGDSWSVGNYASSPTVNGYAALIAKSNNWTLNNYASTGKCVADYYPQLANYFAGNNQLALFEGGINDDIRDSTSAQIGGFSIGLLGMLTALEVGTNMTPGTNMTVLSGTWSNTVSTTFNSIQNPTYGVVSTGIGAALSNEVYGKTIIIEANDCYGSSNIGGAFSVTIDGVTLGTNWLTNQFASTSGLAYEPAAFYYPNLTEGFHSVLITNVNGGNVDIEFMATPETVPNPPWTIVFNIPPQTNYATGPGGSEASVELRNTIIQKTCDLMDYCQFPVSQFDTYGTVIGAIRTNFYNTNIFLQGDAVHLTNGGHALVAQAVQRQLNRSPVNMKFNDTGMSIHTDGNALILDESASISSFPAIAFKGTGAGLYSFYVKPDGSGQLANSTISFDAVGDFTAANFGTPGVVTATNGLTIATNSLTWSQLTNNVPLGGASIVMCSNVLWSIKNSNNIIVSNRLN